MKYWLFRRSHSEANTNIYFYISFCFHMRSQQGLLKVLKAYTQFRPDEGYCQAQGPVAAVLLMNMPLEVHICTQTHRHIS